MSGNKCLRYLCYVACVGLIFTSVVRADVFDMPSGQTSLEMVPVGSLGNSIGSDGYGAVAYNYRIGTYEVTAAQYTEFLNAVAGDDTYGLYSTDMTATNGCQIQRSGTPGFYTYSVSADSANRPVNKVSWGDAARFVNWLHNGRPTGTQDVTTTEDGAYYLNGATSSGDLLSVAREADYLYALPSQDEWFKAAYHKNNGPTDNYWLYPTASDTDPTAAIADPDPGNNANFNKLLSAAPWRTVVGEFENSVSAYGTYDQGGNVWEMTEGVSGSQMVARGGSYWENDFYLRKTNPSTSMTRVSEENNLGFRIVTGPPPIPTDVFNMPEGLTSLETVPVGNVGNEIGIDQLGAVAYDYEIGTFEVTAAQYTVFLNAVAADDTYSLYNTEMVTSSHGCQIQRTGSPGSYTYTVGLDVGNRPVNKISWADAARFVNWLHNGQPTGAQDLTTTEDGAYYLNGATSEGDLLAVTRKADSTFALPTEHEWFKAAYHRNNGVTDNYWLYPTATDTDPTAAIVEPDPGNNANFNQLLGGPPWRTEVGEFENSASPYGTYDQGGNVAEMTEDLSGSQMIVRGGSYWYNDVWLRKTNKDTSYTRTSQESIVGFRVVIPPPPAPTDVFDMGEGFTSLETVPVGNAGNANGADGHGGVAKDFSIGKYEVTAAQYTVFLNAVASDDTYGLYNTEMVTSSHGCRINRLGDPGSYTYTVGNSEANRPVNKISWADAARFVNWLHNGQPSGAQDITTTEDGAYYLNGATSEGDLLAVTRKAGSSFAIPNEDEWFKAAYHKNDGVTDHYWLYPTMSDIDPTAAIVEPDPGNNANFNQLLGAFPWRTEVGEFENSLSAYGTFDQGGNVAEMTEGLSGSQMIVRGGSYWYNDFWLRKTNDDTSYTRTSEESIVGFRLVVPPEPACGDLGYFSADLNQDCYVDSGDVDVLAGAWTDCTMPGGDGCTAVSGFTSYSIPQGTVTVDGDLSEWTTDNWHDLDQPYYNDPDASDLSDARYAARWSDASNELYVAVTGVDTDQMFFASHSGWNGQDAAEIYVEADNDDSTGYSIDYAEAQHYVGSPTDTVSGDEWLVLGDTPIPAGAMPPFEVVVNGNTISYEIAVKPYDYLDIDTPASSTEVDLGAGSVIGLDVVMNTLHTAGFGMLSENLMDDKYDDAGNLRDHTLAVSYPVCGDWGYLAADLDNDCYVGLGDFAVLTTQWQQCTDPNGTGCTQP